MTNKEDLLSYSESIADLVERDLKALGYIDKVAVEPDEERLKEITAILGEIYDSSNEKSYDSADKVFLNFKNLIQFLKEYRAYNLLQLKNNLQIFKKHFPSDDQRKLKFKEREEIYNAYQNIQSSLEALNRIPSDSLSEERIAELESFFKENFSNKFYNVDLQQDAEKIDHAVFNMVVGSLYNQFLQIGVVESQLAPKQVDFDAVKNLSGFAVQKANMRLQLAVQDDKESKELDELMAKSNDKASDLNKLGLQIEKTKARLSKIADIDRNLCQVQLVEVELQIEEKNKQRKVDEKKNNSSFRKLFRFVSGGKMFPKKDLTEIDKEIADLNAKQAAIKKNIEDVDSVAIIEKNLQSYERTKSELQKQIEKDERLLIEKNARLKEIASAIERFENGMELVVSLENNSQVPKNSNEAVVKEGLLAIEKIEKEFETDLQEEEKSRLVQQEKARMLSEIAEGMSSANEVLIKKRKEGEIELKSDKVSKIFGALEFVSEYVPVAGNFMAAVVAAGKAINEKIKEKRNDKMNKFITDPNAREITSIFHQRISDLYHPNIKDDKESIEKFVKFVQKHMWRAVYMSDLDKIAKSGKTDNEKNNIKAEYLLHMIRSGRTAKILDMKKKTELVRKNQSGDNEEEAEVNTMSMFTHMAILVRGKNGEPDKIMVHKDRLKDISTVQSDNVATIWHKYGIRDASEFEMKEMAERGKIKGYVDAQEVIDVRKEASSHQKKSMRHKSELVTTREETVKRGPVSKVLTGFDAASSSTDPVDDQEFIDKRNSENDQSKQQVLGQDRFRELLKNLKLKGDKSSTVDSLDSRSQEKLLHKISSRVGEIVEEKAKAKEKKIDDKDLELVVKEMLEEVGIDKGKRNKLHVADATRKEFNAAKSAIAGIVKRSLASSNTKPSGVPSNPSGQPWHLRPQQRSIPVS